MRLKKWLIGAMAFVLIVSSLGFTPSIAQAATVETATPITSIQYDFTVTGVNEESSLGFTYTTASSWTNVSSTHELTGDGDYSITIKPNNVLGIRNMGFFETINESGIKANLTRMVVNNQYELNYVKELEIGSASQNGLHNIWDETLTPGSRIAEGADSYIMLNSDKSAFVFYTIVTKEDPEDPVDPDEQPVSPTNPKNLVTITEAELRAAGVNNWSAASKAVVYVRITKGGSHSLINGVIKLGPNDTEGNPIGKASSKYLVGRTNDAGKTGNAIQDYLVGAAGTGIYKFPDINLNKSLQDNSAWDDSYANFFNLTLTAMSEQTEVEFLGIQFNNGAVYPAGFKASATEAVTYDEIVQDNKELLKLSLDYCATMNASKYLPSSWSELQAALTMAWDVYNNPSSTNPSFAAARDHLMKVKAAMQFVPASDPGNPLPFRVLSGDETVYEMGVGINLGNTLDGHSGFVPSETAWQNVMTTKNYIRALHDAGYNTIRIPVTWGTMIDKDNGYAINPNWMSRVQDIVDYAISLDMYAIINIHHDGAEQTGWLRVAADDIDAVYHQFEHVWRNIAEYFKDYDEHLIFESMNEITIMEGDMKNSQEAILKDTPIIMNFNQLFVNVVRATGSNNAKRWLTAVSHYANTGTHKEFAMPVDPYNQPERLMFAAHIYKSSTSTTWTYNQVYEVVDGLKKMADKFKVPMFLGEYGTRNYKQSGTATGYNDVARAYFSEIVHKASQVAGIVPVVWDQGYNDHIPIESATGIFTFWDRANLKPVFKTITDAMMRGSFLPTSSANRGYDFRDIKEGVTVKEMTDIVLGQEKVALKLGDSLTVSSQAVPADSNDVILWSSDDEYVATVYRGMIRGRGIGSTTIRAYSQSGSVEKELQVTVTGSLSALPAEGIITQEQYTVAKGRFAMLQASVTPIQSPDRLTYKSSNEDIATVNAMGKITGVNTGTTFITITAESGVTKTVSVKVIDAKPSGIMDLSLNVLYNDSTTKYHGVENGPVITVAGNGQYMVTFDIDQDLSRMGRESGVTEINRLTAIYIKDHEVSLGNETTSPLVSAQLRYDKVTVNGQELTITQPNFKSALTSSGVFDTGGPLNGYDGSAVQEVTTSRNVVSFTGIQQPKTIAVTFTLENVEFIPPIPDKLNEATEMTVHSEQKLVIENISEQADVAVRLEPADTDSLVTFVSSNTSIVQVSTTATAVQSDGIVVLPIVAVGKGKAFITARTENGLMVTFEVIVGEEDQEVPGPEPTPEPTPNPTPDPTPSPTPDPTPNPTSNPTPNPTSNPIPTPVPSPTPSPDGIMVETGTPVVKEIAGVKVAEVAISGEALADALAQLRQGSENKVVIQVDSSENYASILLPTAVLTPSELTDAVLSIQHEGTVYELSMKEIAHLRSSLALTSENTVLRLTMGALNESSALKPAQTGKQVGHIYEFQLTAESNGASTAVPIFSSFVERRILLPEGTDIRSLAGAMYNEAEKAWTYVPTRFNVLADGQVEVIFASLTNGYYTVIEGKTSFADLSNHPAKDSIERLASMGILAGTGNDRFEPGRAVTRAQFATMLTKAFALPETNEVTYKDVAPTAWYAGAVRAAAGLGVVNGYPNDTFRPDAHMTREQMISMVMNAYMLAASVDSAQLEQAASHTSLESYSDHSQISSWAAQSMQAAVALELIQGRSGGMLAPQGESTRAEAAVIISNLLKTLGYWNN